MLVLIVATLVLASAVAAFQIAQSVQQRRAVAQARTEGLAAYQRGDLDQAISKLSYVFQYKKDDLEVNTTFAEARSRVPLPDGKHLVEAATYYTKHGLSLLDADPSIANADARRREIHHRLLKLNGQLGLEFELVQTADRILVDEPDSIDAIAAKAEAAFLDREFDNAAALTDRLIVLDADNLNWRRLRLEIEQSRGTPDHERLDLCRQWTDEYERDGRFHLLTAGVLVEMDRLEGARAELEVVASRGVPSREVLERAVMLLDLMGLPDQANELLSATQTNFPDQYWVREVSVRRLWRANRLNQALAELEQAQTELNELSPGLQRLKVLTLICARRAGEAQQALAPLIEASTKDPARDADRAWAAAVNAALDPVQANWRDGMQAIGKALALSPNDPVLHYLVGDACLRVGEHSQAVQSYKLAHELDPDWMAAGIAYGEALLAVGRIHDAHQVSRIVVSRAPHGSLPPLILYARAHLALREIGSGSQLAADDAELDRDLIETLVEVNEQLPCHPQVVPLLAQAFVQFDQRDHAAQLISFVAQDERATAPLFLTLAELSFRRGLNAEQLLLDRAQAIAGISLPAALLQARVLAAHGDPDGGLAIIDRAIASSMLDENQTQAAACDRAAYLLQAGHPQAKSTCEYLVERYPESAPVQQFVLSQQDLWSDSDLVARAMANLRRILGNQSHQVRLAEANFFIRHHANNQSLLAKAVGRISDVLGQSSDSLAALSLMAEASLLGERPDIERSIECLQRAASLYPGEPTHQVRLIALLQQRGDFDRAGHYLRTLARLSSLYPQMQSTELRLLQAQGDFESALVRAAAIVTESSPPPDQLIYAAIQHGAGNVAQAENIYERLLERQDPSPLVRVQAADFYAATGRFERGLDLLLALPEDDSANSSSASGNEVTIGSFCQRHGRSDQAAVWLTRAVEHDPQSPLARYELARHFLLQHDRSAARTHALAGLKLDPANQRLRTLFAIASLGLPGTSDGASLRRQAIDQVRQLGTGNDDLIALLLLLDKVPLRDGKLAPTSDNLVEAGRLVEQHGAFLPIWLLAISLHVDADQTDDAVLIARNAVSRFPGQIEPSQWATQLLMQLRQWNEALVEAQEWRRRSLSQPLQADIAIASILLELNRPVQALGQLAPHEDHLLAERDHSPDSFAVWIRAMAFAGQYDRAASLVRPLLSRADWRGLWIGLAQGLNPAHAEAALLLIDPSALEPREQLALAEAWNQLAQRLARPEFFTQAHDLAVAAGRDPQYAAAALVAQGAIAQSNDDSSAAEAAYRSALRIEPDNPGALNNLAYLLAQSPDTCDEALALIQGALKRQSNQPDLLDTFARVLRGLDRLDEAEQALNQALAARPDDLGIALHLAELHISQQRLDDADRQLHQLQRRMSAQPQPNPQHQKRLDSLRDQLRSLRVATSITKEDQS